MAIPDTVNSYIYNHEPTFIVDRRNDELDSAEELIMDFFRPSDLLVRGSQLINDAQWFTEHEIQGVHCLVDDGIPNEMLAKGLREIEKCTLRGNKLQYQAACNTLMAKGALEWLCNPGRLVDDDTFADVMDGYLMDVAISLSSRYQQYVTEQKGPSRPQSKYVEQTGMLLEAVTIGLILEDKNFRDAKIIPLAAPPDLERGSKENTSPVDILLWKIQEDATADIIGGFQCKAKSKSIRALTENQFTVIYTPPFVDDGQVSTATIIEQWLNQENLEKLHDHLLYRIKHSKNEELKEALRIN